MPLFNSIFVTLIFLLSIAIVRDDIKEKKIKNKILLTGFLLGAVVYLGGLIVGVIDFTYFGSVLLNAVIGLIVGYSLWNLNLWPAGDAKLFSLFVFLLPLYYYWKSYLPLFPAFSLLVNIFIPVFLVILFKALLNLALKLKQLKNLKKITIDFLLKAKYYYGYYVKGRDLWALLNKARKIYLAKTIKRILASMVVFLATYLILGKTIGMGSFFQIKTFASLAVWIAVAFTVRKYIKDSQEELMMAEKISGGMVVSLTDQGVVIFEKDFISSLGVVRADGLTGSQAELLRDFCRQNNIQQVLIQKYNPFSPWITLGVLLTVALKHNVFQLLMGVINK